MQLKHVLQIMVHVAEVGDHEPSSKHVTKQGPPVISYPVSHVTVAVAVKVDTPGVLSSTEALSIGGRRAAVQSVLKS